MKLLVLTTSWPSDVHDPAGAFVKEMTDALKAHGFSSHVVALDAPVGGALATWQSRGRMKLVRPVLDMTKRALAANVDAVLSHWLVPSALIGSTLGLPHVGVAHGGDVRVLDQLPKLRRALVNSLDGVIAVSSEVADRLYARNTLVQPMGVHAGELVTHSDMSQDGTLRLLFLGRLVPIKGLITLIRAVCGVEGITLTVAGDGPLMSLAAAAPSNVRFVGAIPLTERSRLFGQHQVVCVPSLRGEGSPRVICESYAAGKLVLGSNVGGIRDLVPAAQRLPVGDVAAWRSALISLRDNPDKLHSGVAKNTFDWTAVSARVAGFLRRCYSADTDRFIGAS